MPFRNAAVILFCALFVLNCGPRKNKTTPTETLPRLSNYSANSPRITLMTWNLENLFDAEDNPKTDDEAYLPLLEKSQIPGFSDSCKKLDAISWQKQCLEWDWTDDVVEIKLSRIAEVIKSVNSGHGPDILVVQEVENLKLLERLCDTYLKDMGYKAYLIENHDARGIDVGLITRFNPTQAPELKSLRSRPGLVTQFNLGDGDKLNLIGVHFPISPTPVEKRLRMFQNLSELFISKHNEFTVALGDFNFPKSLQEQTDLINTYAKPHWIVSHLYCTSCEGTFYDAYEESWSQLDMVLLSKNFLSPQTTWTLDPDSVHIHHPLAFQNTYNGFPSGFNLPNRKGISDHWPLVMQLVKTDKILF